MTDRLGVEVIDNEDVIRLCEPGCKATSMFLRDVLDAGDRLLREARDSVRRMDCSDEMKTRLAAPLKQATGWRREFRNVLAEARAEVEVARADADAVQDEADGVGALPLMEAPDFATAPAAPARAAPRPPRKVVGNANATVGLPDGVSSSAGE